MQTVNGAERRGGQAKDIESFTPLLKTTEATVGSTQTSNVFSNHVTGFTGSLVACLWNAGELLSPD